MFFIVMFLMSCFLLFLKQKMYKMTKYDAFLVGKDSIHGQSECFVAVLLTLFDLY